MTDKEIKEVLSRGEPTTYTLDPSFRNEITRSTLDLINREVKKHLSSKKRVSVLLVKG